MNNQFMDIKKNLPDNNVCNHDKVIVKKMCIFLSIAFNKWAVVL